MRMYAFVIAAAALFALSVPGVSQAGAVAPRSPYVTPPSEGRSVAQPHDCGQLKKACLDEDELGQGQSSCQHFRDTCGSNWIRYY
jgi:hypothetical protein